MPLSDNPSFETAGASAGLAQNWSVTITFNGYLIGDFGESGIPFPVETFTGASWGTSPFSFTLTSGTVAVFDAGDAPQPANEETFIRWFNNVGYQTEVSGGVAGDFDGGTATWEGFDAADWGIGPGYATEVSIAEGNVGASFTEDFEAPGWGVYVSTVVGGTAATFDLVPENAEDFEEVSADVLFVVDNPATGLCTTPTPHGKANDFRVTVLSDGTRPSGIAANQVYYLVGVGASSFQLSKTIGGAPVTFSDYGNGSHYLHADERVYWTEVE